MASKWSLSARVTWAAGLMLIACCVLSSVLYVTYRNSVYGQKRATLAQAAEIGAGVVRYYATLAEKGKLPIDEAKRLALTELKALRYSGEEYFWINDLEPRMVMHPTKPAMDGQDLKDYKDPNGKRLFIEMVAICRKDGRGVVEYEWPRAAGGDPVPKFSHVILIPSWGWVVGTGVYVDDVESQLRTALSAFVGLFLMAVVGGVCGLWYVRRSVVRPLRELAAQFAEGANQVSSAAREVSTGSSGLSHGSISQAASLEETSASMEEMASMTRRNAENSVAAAEQVQESDRLVSGANDALASLVTSMTAIRESSAKVTKIVRTIDEIAFQTNILALNAAVEAARAGEAGMGFAVVADEVRNLAHRSAQAAKDTAGLIEESAATAQIGGAKVDAVVRAMTAITSSSARVKDLVAEVSEASRQQTQGIDQVTQAITQMEKLTQTTAATAEESAAASEELSGQADYTLRLVSELETLVNGTGHTTPGPGMSGRPVAALQTRSQDHSPNGIRASAAHQHLAPTGTEG